MVDTNYSNARNVANRYNRFYSVLTLLFVESHETH